MKINYSICKLSVILYLAFWFSTSKAATSDLPQPPLLGALIDVNGHRVHLYCTGEGSPTVIVVSGGFSFDWGIVQPKVAQSTRICTYDTAGTAWSDPVPGPANLSCRNRVDELHTLLKNAGISSPIVLVGFSIGGLIARLYAARYQDQIAGLVFVDHAFIDTPKPGPVEVQRSPPSAVDSPPVLISQTPIVLDFEDDRNFSKLPEKDQELHRWALSIHSLRPTPEMAEKCFSEVADIEDRSPFPFADRPVAVVSTLYDSSRYTELQRKLLMLSKNSKQFLAENSSHMVIIDQPEIVIQAIDSVVAVIKGGGSLQNGSFRN